jgi:hypothetical protein
MSIENHKWSDGQLLLLAHSDDEIHLEFTLIPEIFSFNKQDAIAIAKHFNVDNGPLVGGIKDLISSCEDVIKSERVFGGNAIEYQFFKSALQKLITKEGLDNNQE